MRSPALARLMSKADLFWTALTFSLGGLIIYETSWASIEGLGIENCDQQQNEPDDAERMSCFLHCGKIVTAVPVMQGEESFEGHNS